LTTHIPTSRGLPWPESPSPDRPHADRAVPGTVVGGRYTLRTPIGHGGMGTVWRGTDSLLRREVAVKEVLLPPAMPPDERSALCERTMREARAAAALSHPSVVQVYDVVTDGGRPWIVMELLEARSLADMVIEDGPLAGRAVAKIGVAMLGALEVAHAVGVLHRDVKPANRAHLHRRPLRAHRLRGGPAATGEQPDHSRHGARLPSLHLARARGGRQVRPAQ
jgi:hypothetical protein